MTRRPPASMTRVFPARRPMMSASLPTATILSPRTAKASASGRPLCSVVTLAFARSGPATYPPVDLVTAPRSGGPSRPSRRSRCCCLPPKDCAWISSWLSPSSAVLYLRRHALGIESFPSKRDQSRLISHGRVQLRVACRKRDKRRQSGRPGQ